MPAHVGRLKSNDNLKFSQEYEVMQEAVFDFIIAIIFVKYVFVHSSVRTRPLTLLQRKATVHFAPSKSFKTKKVFPEYLKVSNGPVSLYFFFFFLAAPIMLHGLSSFNCNLLQKISSKICSPFYNFKFMCCV